MKKENISSVTKAKEIDEMIARGESQTDWHRIHLMTEEEIEQNANTVLNNSEYPC